MRLFRIYFLLVLFIGSTFLLSGKPPSKYGDVSKEMLKMKKYPKDSSAKAVVIFDYGRFDADQFTFQRHLRVKIFHKDAYHRATRTIRAKSKFRVKGCTYNLDDGKIKSHKLKNKHMYTVNVTNGQNEMRVALPNVKEGSIFELQYVLKMQIPRKWQFQRQIFVMRSELIFPQNEIGNNSTCNNIDQKL